MDNDRYVQLPLYIRRIMRKAIREYSSFALFDTSHFGELLIRGGIDSNLAEQLATRMEMLLQEIANETRGEK